MATPNTYNNDFWGPNYSQIEDYQLGNPYARTAIYNTVTGQAVGATATATHAHVQGNIGTNDIGGQRNVVVLTDINRATTNADVTNLKKLVNQRRHRAIVNNDRRPPFPRDASGNGGPALA